MYSCESCPSVGPRPAAGKVLAPLEPQPASRTMGKTKSVNRVAVRV